MPDEGEESNAVVNRRESEEIVLPIMVDVEASADLKLDPVLR